MYCERNKTGEAEYSQPFSSKSGDSQKALLKVTDDGKIRVVSDLLDLFVDHTSKNTQLGGTAVVQFNTTLEQFLLLIEFIPSEVNPSVTEVTNELVSGSWDILHEGDLKETNEADDLSDSVEGNGIGSLDGSNTVGVGIEGVTGVVNVSWKVDSGTGDDLSQEGKLG